MLILYLVFCIFSKNSFYIFTYPKISLISREYIFSPLSNRGWFEKLILTSIQIFNIFLNLTISKIFNKNHNFRICYNILLLINHSLWNCPRSQTRKKKTESDLTTPYILLQYLHPLHIDMTDWIKTPTQTLLLSYHHHILIILYKPNSTVIKMPL